MRAWTIFICNNESTFSEGDKRDMACTSCKEAVLVAERSEVLKEVYAKLIEIGPPILTSTRPADPLKAFAIWLSNAIFIEESR